MDGGGPAEVSADTDARAGAAALDQHRRGLAAGAAGRPAAAAGHFRAGLRLLEPDPPPGTELIAARLLTSLAHAEAEVGRVERGLELLERAGPLARDSPLDRALVISQRGLLLWRVGRYQAALPLLDEAVPLLADHPDRIVLARVLLNRGGLHMSALRLAAARADLRRCEEIARACDAPLMAAKAVHNRGYCELLAGDIPAALAALETAEAGYRVHGPGILPIAAVDRSRALLAVGLADEAASGLESAIAAFREQRLSQDRAEAELALAQALAAADKPAEAAARAREAERHFRARGNETCAALAELTRARADFAAVAGAVPVFGAEPGADPVPAAARRRCSALARRTALLSARLQALGLANDAALAGTVSVRALIRAGRPLEQAAEQLGRIRLRGGAVPMELRLSAHLARAELAAARGGRRAALAELRTGLAHLHQHRLTLGSLDLQAGTGALGRELTRAGLRLALDSGEARTVFAWSERSRGQAFRVRPVRPPDDPAMAAAVSEYRHLDDVLRTAELNGRSDLPARQRHAALQRRLREQSWKTTAHRTAAPTVPAAAPAPLAATVRELAESGQAMISLLRQGDRLLALAVADGRTRLVRLGSYPAALEAAYRLLGDLDARVARRLPERLQAVIDQSIRRQLDVLTREVTAPVRALIGDLPVVVVPTGPLAAVPWSLLPDLRGRPVTVCPSAQLWLAARRAQEGAQGDAPDPRPVLAAGPRLAHAETEVAAIARLYSDPVVLTGRNATVEATLKAMDGARTVHLAAHGHHERGNVLFARIDLADGPLMAYDLQRLAKPPQRVILSACEVGRADVRSGDEHLGFTAALLYAGTSTVISSGALVPDDEAPGLMAALHFAVAAGSTPAAALAAAMTGGRMNPFVCFGAG
jgi:tetratricopeptide (TPR) repeat protein